jgi:RNA polymerase sigma factor (sigma-70 family)
MTAIDYPVAMTAEQNRRIAAALERERKRLARFIRRRVPDPRDAEDVLQDAFAELVEAYRLMQPIEHVGAWLFRVARNRITDLFRRRSSAPTATLRPDSDTAGNEEPWEDLLPSADGGPDTLFARGVLLDELDAALDELPEAQREVFVAHELEGRSFQELAAELGVGVNTLLARKHYAVRHLRRRLAAIYEEFSQP